MPSRDLVSSASSSRPQRSHLILPENHVVKGKVSSEVSLIDKNKVSLDWVVESLKVFEYSVSQGATATLSLILVDSTAS